VTAPSVFSNVYIHVVGSLFMFYRTYNMHKVLIPEMSTIKVSANNVILRKIRFINTKSSVNGEVWDGAMG
jgi:hypothetical protein